MKKSVVRDFSVNLFLHRLDTQSFKNARKLIVESSSESSEKKKKPSASKNKDKKSETRHSNPEAGFFNNAPNMPVPFTNFSYIHDYPAYNKSIFIKTVNYFKDIIKKNHLGNKWIGSNSVHLS